MDLRGTWANIKSLMMREAKKNFVCLASEMVQLGILSKALIVSELLSGLSVSEILPCHLN